MSDLQRKAEILRCEAHKKLKTKSFFEVLFGESSNKVQQAIECNEKAGNLFKVVGNWEEAAQCYEDAVELHLQQNELYNAASLLVQAAKCYYKKSDFSNSILSLTRAIDLFLEIGKFVLAAKNHQTIAEILEENLDVVQASWHFERAADYFKSEDNVCHANKCLVKVAEFAALQENYEKATGIFESIACNSLTSSLMQFQAKEHFFKALVCYLCEENAQEIVNKALKYFEEVYPGFKGSRESVLIETLLEAKENFDETAFSVAIQDFDSMSKLSDWYVTLLLRVKRQILDIR